MACPRNAMKCDCIRAWSYFWNSMVPVLAQTALYLVLLGSAAVFDLYRKNL